MKPDIMRFGTNEEIKRLIEINEDMISCNKKLMELQSDKSIIMDDIMERMDAKLKATQWGTQ